MWNTCFGISPIGPKGMIEAEQLRGLYHKGVPIFLLRKKRNEATTYILCSGLTRKYYQLGLQCESTSSEKGV